MIIDKSRFEILKPAYNSVFHTQYGSAVGGDYSLSALLRYIRIKKSDIPEATGNAPWVYDVREMRCSSIEDFKDYLTNADAQFSIMSANGRFMPADDETLPEGWKILLQPVVAASNIASVLRIKYKTDAGQCDKKANVYINESKKSVVVLCEEYCFDRLNARIKSCLWLFMPWYYSEMPSKEEIEFFRLFDEDKDDAAIVEEINKLALTVDARTAYLKSKLIPYEANILARREDDLTRQIESEYNSIANNETRIANSYRVIQGFEAELKAFRLSKGTATSEELCNFFITHKNVEITNIGSDYIEFEITDTIEYYDEEECKECFDNERSYIYEALGSEPVDVFRAIFVDKVAKPVASARFSLNGMKQVSVQREQLTENRAVLPHPHLYRWGCWGGNDTYMREYARRGEWQLQIEQSIGAVKNINWGDQTVCSWMIRWFIRNKSVKCLLKDGVMMSYSELKAELKKAQKKAAAEAAQEGA